MSKSFSFLNPNRLKKLFSKKSIELRSQGSTSEHDSENPPPDLLDEINLNYADPELLNQFGTLLSAYFSVPCLFICSAEGDVIWQKQERDMDIDNIREDILNHLDEVDSNDIAIIENRSSSFKDPKAPKFHRKINEEGVACFSALAPLRHKGDFFGAICLLSDSHRKLSDADKKQFKTFAALLSEHLVLQTQNSQYIEEQKWVQPIKRFMEQKSGDAFLALLIKEISNVLEIDLGFIAWIEGKEEKAVAHTVAVSHRGASVKNFEYPLKPSPIKDLSRHKVWLHEKEVSKQFPNDEKIKAEHIEGFAALPLTNSLNKPVGLIVLMNEAPLKNTEKVEAVLKEVSGRVCTELQIRSSLRSLQEDLDLEKSKFEAFLKNASFGLAVENAQGQLKLTSPAFRELLGYSKDELEFKSLNDLCNKNGKPTIDQLKEDCIDNKESCYDTDQVLIHKDGHPVNAHITASLLKNNLEKKPSWVITVENKTETENLEHSLTEQTDLLNSLLHSSATALFVTDSKGNLVKSNQATEHLLDSTGEELRLKSIVDFISEKDRKEFEKQEKECREGKREKFQFEAQLQSDKKSLSWALLTLCSIKSKDNKHAYFIGTLENRSEYQKLETSLDTHQEELKAQAQKFKALLEPAAVGIAISDEKGTLRQANQSLKDLFKAPQKELLGKTLGELSHSEDTTLDKTLLEETLKGKRKLYQVEKRFLSLEEKAKPFWVRLTVSSVLNQNGGFEYFIAMFEDISRRKELEEELKSQDLPLHHLLDHTETGIIRLNSKGKLSSVNPGFCKLLQKKEADILKQSFFQLGLKTDHGDLKNLVNDASSSQVSSSQVHYSTSKKEQLHLILHLTQLPHTSEDQKEYFCLVQNQTALHLAEKKASRLSHKFDSLFNQKDIAIALSDDSSPFSQTNQAFRDLFEYEAEELRYKSWTDLSFEEDASISSEDIANCLSGKQPHLKIEKRFQNKNHSFWGRLSLITHKDPNTKKPYTISIIENITPQIDAQHQLQLEEAKLSNLYSSAPIAIATVDNAGHLIGFNPALSTFLNTSEETLHSLQLKDLVHENHVEELNSLFSECQSASREHFQVESLFSDSIHSKEEALWGRITCTALHDTDNHFQFAFLFIENITRRKAVEEKLQTTQTQLEALQQELETEKENLSAEKETVSQKESHIEELNSQLEEEKKNYQHSQINLHETESELENTKHQVEEKDSQLQEKEEHLKSLEENLSAEKETVNQKESHIEELNQSISEKEEQVTQHQSNIEELNQSISEKEEQLAQHQSSIEELQTRLNSLEEELQQEKETVSQQTSQMDQNQNTIQELESSLAEKENSLAQQTATLETTQSELSALQEKLTELENTLSENHLSLEDQENQLSSKENDLSELREKHQQTEETLTSVQQHLEEVQSELSEKKSQLEEVQQQLETKTNELQGLHERLSGEEEKAQKAHEDLSSRDQELTEAEQKLIQYEEEVQSLNRKKEKIEEISGELEAKEKELATAQEALEKSHAAAGTLEEQLHKAEEAIRQLQNANASQESNQATTLREADEKLNSALAELEETRQKLETKEKELEENASQYQLEVQTAQTGKGELQNQIEDREKEIQSLRTQVENLELKLQENETNQKEEKQEEFPEVLEKSESNSFYKLFQQSPIGIALVNEELKIVQSNVYLEQLLGYGHKELIHKPITVFSHPEDKEQDFAFEQEWLSGDSEPSAIEKRIPKKNGDLLWIRLNRVLVRDSSKKVVARFLALQNMTRRQFAEDALEGYRETFYNAPLGLIVHDNNDNLVRYNPASAIFLGYEYGEFDKISFNEKGKAEDPTQEVKLRQELEKNKRDYYQVDKKFTRKDGSSVWGRLHVAPLKREGNIRGIVTIVEDISALHQEKQPVNADAPEAKKESKKDVRKATSAVQKAKETHNIRKTSKILLSEAGLQSKGNIDFGFITADLDGRVVLMNRKGGILIGWNLHDAFGHELTEVYQVQNQTPHYETTNSKNNGEGSQITLIESKVRSKDGSSSILIQSSRPLLNEHGTIIGTAIVFVEKSEIQKNEKELFDNGIFKTKEDVTHQTASDFDLTLLSLGILTSPFLASFQSEILENGWSSNLEKASNLTDDVVENLHKIND